MNPQHIWLNGNILPLSKANVSPLDPGLTLGHGLFETLLAPTGTSPFNFSAHFSRLSTSAHSWNITLPSENELLTATKALLEKEALEGERTRLRITATPESLSIIAFKIDPLPETLTPLKVQTFSPYRRNEHSPLLGQKSISYAENSAALKHAQAAGYDEALLLNTAGHLSEATAANLFIVKDGTLLTPSLDSGCLPGTSRSLVLEIAKELSITALEQTLSSADYHNADEAFLTNAIKGIHPISHNGPLAMKIRQQLLKHQGLDH